MDAPWSCGLPVTEIHSALTMLDKNNLIKYDKRTGQVQAGQAFHRPAISGGCGWYEQGSPGKWVGAEILAAVNRGDKGTQRQDQEKRNSKLAVVSSALSQPFKHIVTRNPLMSKTCLHRWLLLVASRVLQPQVETSLNSVHFLGNLQYLPVSCRWCSWLPGQATTTSSIHPLQHTTTTFGRWCPTLNCCVCSHFRMSLWLRCWRNVLSALFSMHCTLSLHQQYFREVQVHPSARRGKGRDATLAIFMGFEMPPHDATLMTSFVRRCRVKPAGQSCHKEMIIWQSPCRGATSGRSWWSACRFQWRAAPRSPPPRSTCCCRCHSWLRFVDVCC